MAGSNPPYHPSSTKPSKPTTTAFPTWKRVSKIYTLPLIVLLCMCSYFLGVWQHGGTTANPTAISIPLITVPCKPGANKNDVVAAIKQQLDFSSHHMANYSGNGDDDSTSPLSQTPKTYPPCDAQYSEYTPCENAKRSLKFSRDRLIYRERHCPVKSELLKCRVPAPYGYRNPFRWPQSRDLVWYANVPHKELTVEKAVQNWIRFEGDRFRFPGGGTMFPNGADAYIDDIGELINLRDGSIRTAIDTGCGVSQQLEEKKLKLITLISFLLSYPMTVHEIFFFLVMMSFNLFNLGNYICSNCLLIRRRQS